MAAEIEVEIDVEKKATFADGKPLSPDDNASGTDTEDVIPTSVEEEEFVPPDGGFEAWAQVFAGCLINMMSWGYPGAYGVYQLYYRDTLKLPEAQISWIGSVQVFLAFVTCTISGRLADAGYIKSTIIAGSFLVVFGTFMTSLCREYWQIFLAQGLCTGLGLGIMFMPPVSVMNSYFKERKTFAMAIGATGTGLGSVIFPAIIQYLIPKVGFPWAVRCSAFVALFIAIVALLILKPRLKPRRSGPLVEWDAFTELPYILYTLGAFLFFWALYFGFFYINAYARNKIGFSTTDSVQLLLITNGMSVPARPVVGYLADRFTGPINTYAAFSLVLSGMLFAWIGVDSREGMYVFSVFFGLCTGSAQCVFGGALASLTKDPRKMGTRFGMVCTIIAFAALAGPPTAGAIIDKSDGRFLYAQIWAGLVIIMASLTFAAARCSVVGFRLVKI